MKKLLLVLAVAGILTGCKGSELDRRHPIQSGLTAYRMAVSPTKYTVEQLESFIIYLDVYAENKEKNNPNWIDSEDQYHWSRAKRVFVETLDAREGGR